MDRKEAIETICGIWEQWWMEFDGRDGPGELDRMVECFKALGVSEEEFTPYLTYIKRRWADVASKE